MTDLVDVDPAIIAGLRVLADNYGARGVADVVAALGWTPSPPRRRWLKNGDHPDDRVGETLTDLGGGPDYERLEGAVVRFFRHPDISGSTLCDECGFMFHHHGWIDSGGDGVTVCPGDVLPITPLA